LQSLCGVRESCSRFIFERIQFIDLPRTAQTNILIDKRLTAKRCPMNLAIPMYSRQSLYRLAWILFLASIILPAPGGSFQGGASAISGLYVVGKTIQWSGAFPEFTDNLNFASLVLLTLALFSNVVFLFTPLIRNCRSASVGCKLFLFAALAVNASVAFMIPVFAKLPAYWLWLASFAALTWAFIALPGNGTPLRKPRGKSAAASSANAESGEVPALIWAWLVWTLFWLGVTAINTYHPNASLESATVARADAPSPAALTSYFNDSAGLLPAADLERFNLALAQFEQQTSNQIAVAIYPRAPQGSIEEFTIRIAERSRLGRKGLDNGAILFIFIAERSARMEVGYGLESVLTDVEARRILDARLAPAFARGDYTQGIDATLAAILDSVRDAYQRGRMPSKLAVLWRQISVELPKLAKQAWPTISGFDLDMRIGIGFFGTLLGLGILDGFMQTGKLFHNLFRSASNLVAGRRFSAGTVPFEFESIWDSLKVLAVLVGGIIAAVGIVVVAGGGTFGGAGTLVHW
jgi:uncharacterized membrane protein YgcG